MLIYNSLTKAKEDFVPINKNKVGVYTCGPTVYDYVTIGNWRTYTLGDLVVRTLMYLGYSVDYLMNITDVGHLTGDNEGDASQGEDRMEKGAIRTGKSAWEIAKFYIDDFMEGYDALNLTHPLKFTRATEYIDEQIELLKRIEEKGYTYKISDGIYFDITKYESDGNKYGELSNIDKVLEARLEPNPEKKNPRDFALWKFSPVDQKRQMEWDSPWGKGFPGWHLECSAMSMKYLGEQFDIHLGGEDLLSTHHPNEIAQSEAATGNKPFVKYWMHGAFLQIDGGRMGKSLGNAYTLDDIRNKGFDYLDLRYFYLTGHYRKKLNFTWQSIDSAKKSLDSLRKQISGLKKQKSRTTLSEEKNHKIEIFQKEFKDSIGDDLNLPKALAVLNTVLKSNIPSEDKLDLIVSFDEVLGLDLVKEIKDKEVTIIPEDLVRLLDERNIYRKNREFDKADEIRKKIEDRGYRILDNEEGQLLVLK